MKLWRISDYADLSGLGGLRRAGRWNLRGRPVVYAAESSALAILEVLVRYERKQLPPPYQLVEIEAPDALPIAEYRSPDPPPIDQSRSWGDRWLAAGKAPLAKVPSAVAPKCFNYLINPAHPDAAKITVVSHGRYSWDARLFG